jgi:hypothetical protein
MDILSIVEVSFSVVLGVFLFFGGALSLLGYMVIRMLRSDKWDDSNMLNALRVISHIVAHPHDCADMYYLSDDEYEALASMGYEPRKPFHYINKDEFSELMKSRPWSK